jgi:hypothetical protein
MRPMRPLALVMPVVSMPGDIFKLRIIHKVPCIWLYSVPKRNKNKEIIYFLNI